MEKVIYGALLSSHLTECCNSIDQCSRWMPEIRKLNRCKANTHSWILMWDCYFRANSFSHRRNKDTWNHLTTAAVKRSRSPFNNNNNTMFLTFQTKNVRYDHNSEISETIPQIFVSHTMGTSNIRTIFRGRIITEDTDEDVTQTDSPPPLLTLSTHKWYPKQQQVKTRTDNHSSLWMPQRNRHLSRGQHVYTWQSLRNVTYANFH